MFRSIRSAIAAVLLAIAAMLVFSACSASTTPTNLEPTVSQSQSVETPDKPVSYDGVWKDDIFEATIAGDSIEIYIVDAESKSLYWKGTFPIEGNQAVSVADRDALDSSLMGSGEPEKVFAVGDKIDFDFTMMGTTKTIHLER